MPKRKLNLLSVGDGMLTQMMESTHVSRTATTTAEVNSSMRTRVGPFHLRALGTMHWLHWGIILASLVLTITAWYISAFQIADKAAINYERETTKIIELVRERMQRYEDALWAGATHINSIGGDIDFTDWQTYANGIGIEKKYPGINGLGVIHYVAPEQLSSYLSHQRELRPDYAIKPPHEESECWPISYIVPVNENEKAVGLDMAHERNRFTAAKLARDSGNAQITGPIILVQDALQAPGFLFFVPFYRSGSIPGDIETRREEIIGLVYAPFGVQKLVGGVLSRHLRNISFSIHDEGTEILNENLFSESGYDPNPLFESTIPLNLYGRNWVFNFRSSKEFRRDTNNYQPTTILIGGILVDLLLLLLFVHISNSNQRTTQLADTLAIANRKIEQVNEELTQFNYRTSHDLVAPLKTIRGYVDLAKQDLSENNIEDAGKLLKRIDSQALRLDNLVQDLLNLCKIDNEITKPELVDPDAMFETLRTALLGETEEQAVTLHFKNELTEPFYSQTVRIYQILENLVSNSVKYSDPDKPERWVKIRFSNTSARNVRIEVADNGIGIPEDNKKKIFEMFYRVGNSNVYGSGLGNYLVKKHVSYLKGSIDYSSTRNGTCFIVDIPTL